MSDKPRWRLVKLVRDRVGQFQADDVTGVKYEPIANPHLAQDKLGEKLIEEAVELVSAFARGEDPLGEAADVYEALRGLVAMKGHRMMEVENVAEVKRQERGGFDELMGMWLLGRARDVAGDEFEDQRGWQ